MFQLFLYCDTSNIDTERIYVFPLSSEVQIAPKTLWLFKPHKLVTYTHEKVSKHLQVEAMRNAGLIKGGSAENALVCRWDVFKFMTSELKKLLIRNRWNIHRLDLLYVKIVACYETKQYIQITFSFDNWHLIVYLTVPCSSSKNCS